MPSRDPSELDLDALPASQLHQLAIAVLVLVVLGGLVDLYLDGPSSWRSWHAVAEGGLIAISATLATLLWRAWRASDRALLVTTRSLAERSAEAAAWRTRAERAVTDFRQAITDQFARWELTPAECEVAMLLLEGHGHKEIAGRTERSERTVRQHAVAVYAKSGCHGRSELAAFFLGGLGSA
jgi:DNA-binding CsgD family transcriptional regulator